MKARSYADTYTDKDAAKFGIDFTGEISRTKQSEAEACDINVIMERYIATGIPPEARGTPMYGDYSDVGTFQEALDIVRQAEAQFAALDARTRGRFQNDPAQFLEFCENPQNIDEMVTLGLATKREVNAPLAPPQNPKKGKGTPKEDAPE